MRAVGEVQVRWRRLSVVAAALLACVMLVVPVRPASAVAFVPAPLVAMGDSFTAGEGSPPFEAGTADGCRRSYLAYARLVALWRTTNLACGGATVASTAASGQHGEAGQLEQLPADARRVVLTLGGNDLRVGDIVRACVLLEDCAVGQAAGVAEGLAGLATALPGVYRAVLDTAAEAHLYVMEYPVLLPATPVDDCTRLAGISTSEQVWARQVNLELNRTIREAVELVAADHPGRITFVPTHDLFAGHAVCDTGVDWMRGLYPVRAWSFHPNYLGQVGLALALDRALVS